MKIKKSEPIMNVFPKKKRVAAYARVSMESDRLLNSFLAQVSFYRELIQKNSEWEFVGVYADLGVSGTDIRKRAEFQRLIGDCNEGKIDIVLCKSISRFARNTVDLLKNIRMLKDNGVEIRFEKENLSTFSPDGEFMLSMFAIFAEEESKSISSNIKWTVKKKFERGKVWHRAAFGYYWNGETFIINEDEAIAVRRIFDDFLNNVPLRHTSKWLKTNGYRASSVTFINYALQNEVYIGNKMLQKKYSPRVRCSKKNNGEMPKYYVEGSHEAIIDKETFERVQARIKESYEFNTAVHRIIKPSCFSGKIKCGLCGANYSKGVTKSKKTGDLKEHWVCYGKIKKGVKYCRGKNIDGIRLRQICCDVLGTEEFDDNIFSKEIKKIETLEGDILKFYFYEGKVMEYLTGKSDSLVKERRKGEGCDNNSRNAE